ncbi:MAG: lipoate--protein ligase family protein, partial [Thermoprotei archaeon]
MSSHSWRIVDTGLRSAAENMALDEIILRAVAENNAPNTIRFLRFSKPCVLVGYHQDIEQEVRLDYCLSKGIEI